MDIKQILELNKHFYESYAKDFSVTRQAPWNGWDKILPYIKRLKSPRIFDVACGNGRFLDFLLINLDKFHYTGLDLSKPLVDEARIKYSDNENVILKQEDILNYKNDEQYDLVVGFGIMHHIPTEELRLEILDNLSKSVKKGGLLILTFWQKQFSQDKTTYSLDNIGKSDYLISWDNNPEKLRYVHIFDSNEVDKYSNQDGFKLIDKFEQDGKDHKSNLYIVMEKL